MIREDKRQFDRCRTRDLILACMSALEAGNTETAAQALPWGSRAVPKQFSSNIVYVAS